MSGHEPDRLPIADAKSTWLAVLALARPQRGLAVLTLVVLVVGTAVPLLVPLILGTIIDAVVDQRGTAALGVPIAQLFGVAVAAAGLGAIGAVLVARVGETMLAGLREQLVLRALAMPLGRIEAAGSGDLVSRISGDVVTVSAAVRTAVPQLVRAALTIVLTLIGMLALDWRFAFAWLVAVPIQMFALRRYLAGSAPLFARERVAEAGRTQRLLDAVRGARTVREYGLADRHVGLIADASQSASGFAYQLNRITNRFYGRLNLAEALGLSATLAIGFVLLRDGSITVGAATAAALFFHRLFDPVTTFLGLFGKAQEAGAALARMVGVLDAAPVPVGDGHTPADSRVRIASVGFHYPGRLPVLQGIDLELAPGEHVAVVGPSGAGKSTLASLLAGVHRPTSGSITIGGVEVDRIEPVQLRQRVYLVTQEMHVFAGTVAENLRLAKPSADDAEVAHALSVVEAQGWVAELPHGIHTLVGEGGCELTSTQAQHLALSRLVLADPELVVLDEATADSGSAGARQLDRAAARALAGRTALVVAHRLTQAAQCDRVAVLQDGRITEVGTPSDLVARGGTYAELWEAWSGARTLVGS